MSRNTVSSKLIIQKWSGETIEVPLKDVVSIHFENDSNYKVIPYDEAIDLGLSVMWASHNVGANNPKEAGKAYAWGMLEPSTAGDKVEDYFDKDFLCFNEINPCICGTKQDVAHMEWGSEWRMPTKEEIEELVNKCEWTYSNKGNGGFTIKGPSGNSIFLPVGYETKNFGTQSICNIWSGTIKNNSEAYYLFAYENYVHSKKEVTCGHGIHYKDRHTALFIRPVLPNKYRK